MADFSADLDRVRVHCGQLVAEHPRSWAKHATITDSAQVAAAAVLSAQFQSHTSRQEQEQSLIRDLAEYDQAFGLHTIEGFGAVFR